MGVLHKAALHAVEDSMGGFMGDNIMGEASEYRSARQVSAGVLVGGGKITEHQSFLLGIVESIGFTQGMRVDAQAGYVSFFVLAILVYCRMGTPLNLAAQGMFEVAD